MKLLKIIGIVFVGIIVIFIIRVLIYIYVGETALPSKIYYQDIKVSDSKITLDGPIVTGLNSLMACSRYYVSYEKGGLYIKINVKLGGLLPIHQCPYNISIPNTFGEINQIYLQGDNSSDNLLIWPKK